MNTIPSILRGLRPASWTVLTLILLQGCSGPPSLMPTPNLYARGNFDPFENVPPQLQNNRVQVLYYTDRQPEGTSPHEPNYGYKRSRSAAFGISELRIGQDVSWPDLAKASRTRSRDVTLKLVVTQVQELARFLPTPLRLIESRSNDGAPPTTEPSFETALQKTAEDAFTRQLSTMLKLTPQKEVYVYVHGFSNRFYDSVITAGQLWHFFGRQGVPIAYTWPAGSKGLLAYMYDRESSEFTVYHLKQMLRLIAACPDVQRINILAHSRGADVATSALRELHLEIRGGHGDTRQVLKLGTLALAAPDLDFDVVMQRLATDHVGQVPERCVIYVCADDRALGLANWLFSGGKRLGQVRSTMFSPEELASMRTGATAQFIDARVSNTGSFGHDYFHSNPAVSSDLILLFRYHLAPGAANARPLRITRDGFWAIDDDYPGDDYPGPPQYRAVAAEGK